jgi:hypothetical protein
VTICGTVTVGKRRGCRVVTSGGKAVTGGGIVAMSVEIVVMSAGMGRGFAAIAVVGLACCSPCVFG